MSNVVGTVEFDVRLNLDQFNKEIARIKNYKIPCIPICFDVPDDFEKKFKKENKTVFIPFEFKETPSSQESRKKNKRTSYSSQQSESKKETVKEEDQREARESPGLNFGLKSINLVLNEAIASIAGKSSLIAKISGFALDGIAQFIKTTDAYVKLSNDITAKAYSLYNDFIQNIKNNRNKTSESAGFSKNLPTSEIEKKLEDLIKIISIKSSSLAGYLPQSSSGSNLIAGTSSAITPTGSSLQSSMSSISSSMTSFSQVLSTQINTSSESTVLAITATGTRLDHTLRELLPKQSLFAKAIGATAKFTKELATGQADIGQTKSSVNFAAGIAIKGASLIPGFDEFRSKFKEELEMALPGSSSMIDSIKKFMSVRQDPAANANFSNINFIAVSEAIERLTGEVDAFNLIIVSASQAIAVFAESFDGASFSGNRESNTPKAIQGEVINMLLGGAVGSLGGSGIGSILKKLISGNSDIDNADLLKNNISGLSDIFAELVYVSSDLASSLFHLNESTIDVASEAIAEPPPGFYEELISAAERNATSRKAQYSDIKVSETVDLSQILDTVTNSSGIREKLRSVKQVDSQKNAEDQALKAGSEIYQRYIEVLRQIGQYDALLIKKIEKLLPSLSAEDMQIVDKIQEVTGKKIKKKSVIHGEASQSSQEQSNDSFVDNGQSIVDGLIKGVESEHDSLENAATNIYRTIDIVVRNKFGIHSPATWGVMIGTNIIKGILNGLATQDLKQGIQSAIDQTISSVGGDGVLTHIIRSIAKESSHKILEENEAVIQSTLKNIYDQAKSEQSQGDDNLAKNLLRGFLISNFNKSGGGRPLGNKGGIGELAADAAVLGVTATVQNNDQVKNKFEDFFVQYEDLVKVINAFGNLAEIDIKKEVISDIINVYKGILQGKTAIESIKENTQLSKNIKFNLNQSLNLDTDEIKDELRAKILKRIEQINGVAQSVLGEDSIVSLITQAINDRFNVEQPEAEPGIPSFDEIMADERPVRDFSGVAKRMKEITVKAGRYAKAAAKTYFDQMEYQGHVFSLMLDAGESVANAVQGTFNRDAYAKMPEINAAIQQIQETINSLQEQQDFLSEKQRKINSDLENLDASRNNLIEFNESRYQSLMDRLNQESNPINRERIKAIAKQIKEQEDNELQEIAKEREKLLEELRDVNTQSWNNSTKQDTERVKLAQKEKEKAKKEERQVNPFDEQKSQQETRRIENLIQSRIEQFDRLFPGVKGFLLQGVAFLGSMETFQSMLGTAVDFVKESLDQVLSLLTDREVLKGLMSSGQEYQNAQKFLTDQVNKFNLDRRVVENGFKGFYASAKGTSLEGDPTQDIFAGITQASRAYNLTTDQQQGAFLALTQMMSRGTISMEELRGQLSERLPGAMAIAARAMNMTQGELVELVSSGQLAADVFLPKFAQQLKNETAGAAKSASGSLRAIQQEYDNIFLNFRIKVIETIEPGLKVLGKGIIEVINVSRKLLPLIGFMAGVTFLNSLEAIVGFIKTIATQLIGIVGLGPLLGTVGAAMASPLVALLPLLAQVFEIKQWIGLFTLFLPTITTLMDGLNAKLEIFGVTLYQSESDKAIERITNSAKKLKETLNASTTAANKLSESTSAVKSVSPIDDKLRWDNKSSQAEIRKGELGAIKDLSYIGGAFAFDIARSDYHSYDQEIRRRAQLNRAATEALARSGINSPNTHILSNASPELIDEYFYSAATNQVEKPKYMKSYDKITALTTFGIEKDFNKLNRKIYKGFDKFTDDLLKALGALPAKVRGRDLIAEGGTAVLSGLNLPLTRGGQIGQSATRAVSRIPGGAAASRGIGQLVKALTNGFKPLIAATSKLTNRFLLSAISVAGIAADLGLMAKASFAPFLPTLSAVLVAMVQFAVLFGVVAAAALVFNKAVSWMKGQGGKTITWTQVQEEWRIKDNEKANKESNQIVDEILKSLNDYRGGTGVLAEAKLNNQRIRQLTFESGNLSDADPRKQQINEQLQQLNLSKDMLDEKINQMKASNLDALQALESQLETEKNPQLIGSLKTQIALIKKTQTMLEVAEAEASNSSAIKSFALALRDLNNSFESIAAQFEIYATRLDIAISKQQIEDFSDPNARFLETKLNVQRKEQEVKMSQSKLESQKKSATSAQSQIFSQVEFGNVQKILRSEIAQLGIDTTGTNMNNFDEMIQLLSFDQISALQERYTDASIQQNLELVASYREKQSEILFGEQELYTKTLELMQAKEAAEMESINSRYDDATKALQLAASKEEAIIRQKVLDEKITQQDAQLQMQQLEEANNAKAIKLTEKKLQAIKSAHSRGIVSTDTYVSESRSLEQQLADEKKQLIESQIALQEAVQQKVLDEMEKALQKANAKLEQSQNHQIAIIRKAQLDRKITEAQAEESLAQLAVDRANAEIQIKQKQLEELRKARAKGFVTESEFASRERDLITELSAANVQRLQEELALRNAIKERILDDLERANAIAEAAITKKTTSDKQESIRTQITEYRTIGDRVDDVASQKALESERNALLEQEQLRAIAVANNQKMLKLGLLTHEEYVDKQIAAEQELADIRTQLLENQLSQQKELANFTISEIERAISESNAAIDKLQSQRSAAIKGEQLAGGDKSVRLAATTAEIAQSESDLDTTQDKLQAVEQQIASIQDAYSQGIISQQAYNDKMTEAEQQLADLRSQNFDQLIGLQQQLADAAIAELERVVQVTERALEGSRTNAEIEIRTNEAAQTQTLGSDVAGQNAEIELNKVERQQSIEKIRLAERELAEIARLRRESILDEETANDRLADGQNKLAQLKLDLIQQEMSARRLAADKAIAELERVKQAVERNLERNQTISKIQIRQTEAKETDRLGSDASGKNAEIAMNELEQEASKSRIRQIEQEMAEIARLRDKGVIDQQTANDRLADSERSLLDLKLGLIEQEMAARRLASEAAIAELERVRQSAMGKIDLRESQEQLQSQQSILKGMDTDSLENLERQAKTAELKIQEQMQRERLQLAKNHQQQIESLRRQGLITEFDYEQRKLDVQKEVLDAEKNLVETRKQIKQAETEEILRQIDLQIAAEQRRINELSAAADAEKALRDHKTKMLDFDKTLMDARSGLESAKSNAVISKLQIQIEETDDPAKKAALQNELHEAKIAQLEREYQIQLQQLNLDKQRNQIAAEQLVAEAEINKLKAESARLEAQMNLSKAQATKDAEQIAIAQSQLNIANKQAQIADLEIAAAQRNLEVQTENYNILKETLNIQHSTAMAEAEAAKRADSRAAAYKSIEDSANGAKSAMEQQANISRQVSRQIITNPVINGIEGDIEPRSFGGFRAKGGPVGMGKSYVVGEKGPELFIPSGSGTIIPNSKPTPVNSLNTPGAGSGNSSNKEISSRLDTLNNRIVQLANSPRNISVSTATPVSDTLNLITKVANTKYPDV